jgi:hypothetical protein
MTTRGYTCILVVICQLSKMIHLITTHNKTTTEEIAQLFMQHIFTLHSLPTSIVSNRDSKFTSAFWTKLFSLLGTELNITTSQYHETDGQTEHTIHTVEDYLKAYVKYNLKDWDLHLPLAEFSYNGAKETSTKFTPF